MIGKQIALCIVWMLALLALSACASGGVLEKVSSSNTGAAYDVYLEAGYAYVTNNDGIEIFDISRVGKPQRVGEFHSGTSFGVYVQNELAYIAGEADLSIVDVRNPTNPQRLGEHASKGVSDQVRVDGSYAYLATSTGLKIVDAPGRH